MRRQGLGAEGIVVPADERKEIRDPALDVCLPHTDLHALVEELHHRQWIELASVYANNRKRAAPADALDRCTKGGQTIDPGALRKSGSDAVREARRRLLHQFRNG